MSRFAGFTDGVEPTAKVLGNFAGEHARLPADVRRPFRLPEAWELRCFLRPVLVRDLPRGPVRGHRPLTWTSIVAEWDAAGLIASPGAGPHWRITARGYALLERLT